MKNKLLILVLLFPSFAFAKDINMKDYPLSFTVYSSLAGSFSSGDWTQGSDSCRMGLVNGYIGYAVSSKCWNCASFDGGSGVAGRLGSTWGIRWIELVWRGNDGKIKTHKYTVNFQR